jgi:hypothetical protein
MSKIIFLVLILTGCLVSDDSEINSGGTLSSNGGTHSSNVQKRSVRNLIHYVPVKLEDVISDYSDIKSVKIENENGSHSLILSSDDLSNLEEVHLNKGGHQRSIRVTITRDDGSKVIRSIR